MNKTRLGADFTVLVDNHRSWCDWFTTRELAVGYARLVLTMVTDRVSVLDGNGAVVAEFNAPDSRVAMAPSSPSCKDPADAGIEVPFASPIA